MAKITYTYTWIKWNNQYRLEVLGHGLKKYHEDNEKSTETMRGKKKSFAEYLEEALKKKEKC